jgi:16S rRNA (cytidine1402-2'-O)-methyltransferase
MQKGKLFLVPSLLGESKVNNVLPASVGDILNSIHEFIVEDERSARRFLKQAGYQGSLDILVLHVLNEHNKNINAASFLKCIDEGKNVAIISEAGCPAVADPGSVIVKYAHEKNIQVVPIVGPSSILLALMASGMNGQHFSFAGYLPKEKNDRIQKIKELEKNALQKDQTQLFIEAPYRNMQLLNDLLDSLAPATRLCIACDITLASEFIRTQTVSQWRKKMPDINKRPAIFIIGK